jgi:hypothetical protein
LSLDKNEVAKAKAKVTAIKRAERRLINRLNDLDWEYDVLKPELEALQHDLARGELPVITVEKDES